MRRLLCSVFGALSLAGCAGTFVVSWERPSSDSTGASLLASVPVRYGVEVRGVRVATTSNLTATVSTTAGTNQIAVVAETETTVQDSDGTRSEWQASAPATASVVERPQAGPVEKVKVRK